MAERDKPGHNARHQVILSSSRKEQSYTSAEEVADLSEQSLVEQGGVEASVLPLHLVCYQVVEEHYSPTEVGKKYKVSPHSIRDWVKKSGLSLPKTYKKLDNGYVVVSSPPYMVSLDPDLYIRKATQVDQSLMCWTG